MAIKGGSIIHVGNDTVLIDRIQTAGPGQVNVPVEKIYELGNYQSVGQVRDVPDLTFSYQSFDVSNETEQLLTNGYAGRSVADGVTTNASTALTSATAAFVTADVGRQVRILGIGTAPQVDYVGTIASVTNGTTVVLSTATGAAAGGTSKTVQISQNGFALSSCVPVDIASEFKNGQTASLPYDVAYSVGLPFLYADSVSYKFGYSANASLTAQLRGDSIFYNPGATYVETTVGTNAANQAVATVNPAYLYNGDGTPRRALSVTVNNIRLTYGVDYTESYGTITNGAGITTVTLTTAYGTVPTTQSIRIMYSSPTTRQYLQAVHPTTVTKPAALRGRDIDVYVGATYDPNNVAASAAFRWTSVQAVNIDWKVTLEKDQELGNYYLVNQDFDVPQVTGSIDIKVRNPAELLAKLKAIGGVATSTEVIGAQSSTPLSLNIILKDAANSGRPFKRIYIPDARFVVPGFNGQVNQKLTQSITFDSDSGQITTYNA
jgi:hypothetical protein